ncbi:MAG: hypothetical protein QM599_03130 [Pseudoxanthomonas sp.]
MDFPAYVPAGARDYIRRTLEGGANGDHWEGINAFVDKYRADGLSDSDDALRGLLKEQACLLRFAHDARMRDAYTTLQNVFQRDDEYADFLRSAEAANMDYTPWREGVKRANALKPKIAETARQLAKLLGQAADAAHGYAPDEFFSIRTLLEATDNHEMDGHNPHMWRAVRGAITGEQREPAPIEQVGIDAVPRTLKVVHTDEEAEAARQADPDMLLIRVVSMEAGEKVERDPKEEARDMLHYAWEKSPRLPALLETVAQVAEAWEPSEGGAIGAAIASRKQSTVAEYQRAFAKLLQESGITDLNADIQRAMAYTANVVLNDPDVDVSPDAVRMALIRAVSSPNDST